MEMFGMSHVINTETQRETEIVATNITTVPVWRDTNKTYLINVYEQLKGMADPIKVGWARELFQL